MSDNQVHSAVLSEINKAFSQGKVSADQIMEIAREAAVLWDTQA